MKGTVWGLVGIKVRGVSFYRIYNSAIEVTALSALTLEECARGNRAYAGELSVVGS